MRSNQRAVVLLSGGLDSTVTFACAQAQGFQCYALTVDYGQRQIIEIESARRIVSALGAADHIVCTVNMASFTLSALTRNIPVPKDRSFQDIGKDIPVTYVPARNAVFLSLATSWAESLGCSDVFIGVNALDHSGYPDCRVEFIEAFEEMVRVGTKTGATTGNFKIHAPLASLGKAAIVKLGADLGVDFSLTHTCYDPLPGGVACGSCDACLLRLRGFSEAGLKDPVRYKSS